MKTLALCLAASLFALTVVAQNTSMVTIEVNGNKTREVQIDGTTYPFDNAYSSTTAKNTVSIPELASGQHTLKVVRTNANGRMISNTKVFFLRSGYDLLIRVNGNGAISTKETRQAIAATEMAPMSSTVYNTLYQDIRRKSSSARITALQTAFNNKNYFFTSSQARDLLLLANTEAQRLRLAKLSVHRITDPENIAVLYNIFNSQSNRNDLESYVVNNLDIDYGTVVSTPISTTQFNTLYSKVQNEWSTSSKVTLLNNAFTTNYLTTEQAKQLILLIPDESNRLHLAKTVYRNITDKTNFDDMLSVLPSQSSRNDLVTYVKNNYGDNIGTVGSVYNTPMSSIEFNRIYTQVQNTWGAGAKMNTLSSTFANTSYYFTTDQAKQLVKLVSSESNRFELAKAAYDNITDPQYFTSMYDVFTNQSYRDELASWVNTYAYNNTSTGTNPAYKTPMADNEYNQLFSQVQNTWGLGAKMSSLSTIFANSSYFFTSAQAKELAKLVSSESNRLTLAKAAYDNITDPTNFLTQMNTILSSESTRRDLAAYVNMYQQ